jgi:hypothetical protein
MPTFALPNEGEFAVTAPDIEHVTFKSRAVEPKTVAANTTAAFLSTKLWRGAHHIRGGRGSSFWGVSGFPIRCPRWDGASAIPVTPPTARPAPPPPLRPQSRSPPPG